MKRLPSNYNALVNKVRYLEDRADDLQRDIIRKAKVLEGVRLKLKAARGMIEKKEKEKDPTYGED